MKTPITTVPLKNRVSGQFEDATLFQGIDADNLAHIETRWRPLFGLRRFEAGRSGENLSEINAEDAHWEWGKKAIAAIRDPFLYDIFILECGGNTQAIMLVRKGGEKCFSRHPDHPRAPLIYVDFLSTAPWNRPRLVKEPVYKGCGRVLVATAVNLSFEEEMAGRIGLHALPGAETFYSAQLGMTDLGKDREYRGLRYFELPASQATTFFLPEPKPERS